MESHPMMKVTEVIGMYFRRAPIFLMFCSSPIAWITDPEPRKSRAL
jgi:hypothetical protein